jgi:hypothetical protein
MSFGKSFVLRRFLCGASRCAWVQELDTDKSSKSWDHVCFVFMPASYDDYKVILLMHRSIVGPLR